MINVNFYSTTQTITMYEWGAVNYVIKHQQEGPPT